MSLDAQRHIFGMTLRKYQCSTTLRFDADPA